MIGRRPEALGATLNRRFRRSGPAKITCSRRAWILEKLGAELTVRRNDEGKTAKQLASAQRAGGFKVWMDYDGPDGFQQYMHDLEGANEDILDLEVIGMSHGTTRRAIPTAPGRSSPRG